MSGDTSEEVGTLRDRRELYDLALKYARAADRRDYELFESIFTADIRIARYSDPNPGPGELVFEMTGLETTLKGMARLESYEVTTHLVANQLALVDGDRASGETYCLAHHISTRDGVRQNYTMAIRYQDRFVRRAGAWKFEERVLLVDWERHQPLRAERAAGLD